MLVQIEAATPRINTHNSTTAVEPWKTIMVSETNFKALLSVSFLMMKDKKAIRISEAPSK